MNDDKALPQRGPHHNLPWRAVKCGCASPHCRHWHINPCEMAVQGGGFLKEDADYIVEACNSYPALVERIARLEAALRHVIDMATVVDDEDYAQLESARQMLEEAR